MTSDTNPKARGPSNGACIANSNTPKICENTVLVVSHEAADSEGNFLKGRSVGVSSNDASGTTGGHAVANLGISD